MSCPVRLKWPHEPTRMLIRLGKAVRAGGTDHASGKNDTPAQRGCWEGAKRTVLNCEEKREGGVLAGRVRLLGRAQRADLHGRALGRLHGVQEEVRDNLCNLAAVALEAMFGRGTEVGRQSNIRQQRSVNGGKGGEVGG